MTKAKAGKAAARRRRTPKDTKRGSRSEPITAVTVVPVDHANVLISQAIEKGLPVETMERLLAMRRELRADQAREDFFRALSGFQAECPVIEKKSKVNYTSKKGGKVSYGYASLDAIVRAVRGPLQEHGFSYTITTKQELLAVTAVCHAHHSEGHSESTEFTIPVDPDAYMNAAQKVASALTYAKRYAFCNAFGIMTGDEDDDTRSTNGKPAGESKGSGPQRKSEKKKDEGGKAASQELLTEIGNKCLALRGQDTDKAMELLLHVSGGTYKSARGIKTETEARSILNMLNTLRPSGTDESPAPDAGAGGVEGSPRDPDAKLMFGSHAEETWREVASRTPAYLDMMLTLKTVSDEHKAMAAWCMDHLIGPDKNAETKPAAKNGTITQDQVKRFWTIARTAGKTDDQVRGALRDLGVESTKDIPTGRYEEIVEWARA